MRHIASLFVLLTCAASGARADVITDWNRIAVPIIGTYSLSAPAYREMAMVHIAMFQCVNALEPRYLPYRGAIDAPPGASKEAAAAVAAARVLIRLHPDVAAKVEGELKPYLEKLSDRAGGPSAIEAGSAYGEKVAATVWAMRANDGANAPDSYRPETAPGRYIPTGTMSAPMWPGVAPWTMQSANQFRPGPPVDLKSSAWATNYNEIKQYGKDSKVRTPQQTETARLWLFTGPATFFPLAVQLSDAQKLDVHENARLFALLAMATADAMIAILDAKYHYEFWRPVTAIRNGDRDGNPKTERDASWDAIAPTPMHPEYPCAHCIVAATAGTVMQAFFGTGTLQPFSLTTPTAPGVVHTWTRIEDYVQEPSNARIWAGIHYRFSTVVGNEMGRKIGAQAVKEYLRPL